MIDNDPVVVLVTGSRNWPAHEASHVMDEIAKMRPDLLVVGCCPSGVDMIARAWAEDSCVDTAVFRAKWDTEGKGAGPRRNARMVAFVAGMPAGWMRMVVAFPRGASPGTRGCIKLATDAGLLVRVRP